MYTHIVPNAQVELLWLDDGVDPKRKEEARHRLSFRISYRRGSSEVVVYDEGDPAPDPETFAVLDEGWNSVLLELKDHCERRERAAKRKSADSSPA